MRVIAGEFKGRKLAAPKGKDLRPTASRVKEAIFSMIMPELPGAVCLDLFAGTGALGIEAISRGAARVYFCEPSAASLEALFENLGACRIDSRRAIVKKADWRSGPSGLPEKCNLVFIDAPYEMCEYYSQILEALAGYGILAEGALLIIERNAKSGAYGLPAGFEKEREKRYGGIGVDLLTYAGTGGRNDL